MLSICHLDAITVHGCSNTRGQGIVTPNCTQEIVATSVHIAKQPFPGGEWRNYKRFMLLALVPLWMRKGSLNDRSGEIICCESYLIKVTVAVSFSAATHHSQLLSTGDDDAMYRDEQHWNEIIANRNENRCKFFPRGNYLQIGGVVGTHTLRWVSECPTIWHFIDSPERRLEETDARWQLQWSTDRYYTTSAGLLITGSIWWWRDGRGELDECTHRLLADVCGIDCFLWLRSIRRL